MRLSHNILDSPAIRCQYVLTANTGPIERHTKNSNLNCARPVPDGTKAVLGKSLSNAWTCFSGVTIARSSVCSGYTGGADVEKPPMEPICHPIGLIHTRHGIQDSYLKIGEGAMLADPLGKLKAIPICARTPLGVGLRKCGEE